MSDDIYTIPPALPETACWWPGCASLNESGDCKRECPLADDWIVACSRCGAAVGASTLRCPICDEAET